MRTDGSFSAPLCRVCVQCSPEKYVCFKLKNVLIDGLSIEMGSLHCHNVFCSLLIGQGSCRFGVPRLGWHRMRFFKRCVSTRSLWRCFSAIVIFDDDNCNLLAR